MAGLTNAAKNAMLDTFGTNAPYMSLHTADPGTTGANEVTGGTPAYARKAVSWASASGGSKATSASVTFDVPAGTTVAFVGLSSAVTAGTFQASYSVTSEVFAGQGTYTVSSLTETLT